MLRVRVPAAVVGLATFAGGVWVGLVGVPVAVPPAVWVVGALVVALLLLGRPLAALRVPAMLAVLGGGHGYMARAADAWTCAARLPAGPIGLTVRVAEPADGRAMAGVEPIGGGCGGRVMARFRGSDTVRAGDRLRVHGRWLAFEAGPGRARGLLVVHGVEALGAAPGWVDGLRNWLHAASRELYGHRAGLVDALIIGRRGTIDPELNVAFARAGLVHILSISGFHVGLIAGWLLLLLRLARVSRIRAAPLATVGVSVYVGFIGAPPPALRAALLAGVVVLEGHRQRQVRPGPLFAVTGVLMLVLDPFALADLGAWLSLSALAGASAFSRWGDRALGRHGPVRILCGSIGATAATAPFTALVLGTVSLIGVPLNIVAIPVAALVVPGVLASLVAHALWRPAAEAAAAGSGTLLDLLEGLAGAAARAPGAAVTFEPGVAPAALAAGVIGALAWAIAGRATAGEAARRAGWSATAGLLLYQAWLVASPTHAGSVATLHFLSVGQGDAAVIRTGHGRWVLVDAGPRTEFRDAGREVVAPFLARHGVRRLDVLIVSHAHLDHLGGAGAVLDRVGAAVVLEPGRAAPDGSYRAFLDAVERAGARWSVARAGHRFELDGVTFEVLHPDTTWTGWGVDLNEDSIVLRIRAGRFDAVLAGDAGEPVEALLRGRVGRVELIKAGHHGSRSATSARWLEELHPAVAVLSVGANRYGHPTPETLGRLHSASAEVWRTDRDGTITVVVDAERMQVRARRRVASYPLQ